MERGQANTGRRVSDDAVRTRTGRDWGQWFELLDTGGALDMNHKEIVALVATYDVEPWWQQSITVQYELERGLRKPNQQGSTFQISRSKTISTPPQVVFDAWHQPEQRNAWLETPVEVRKANAPRSLRLRWSDDTPVDVFMENLGEDRSRVSLQHSKLTEEQVEERKEFWSHALDRLKAFLESQ